jgi:hypothetical protein
MKISKAFTACLITTFFIGSIWGFKDPTDQELFANVAKAIDFHPWSGWWSSMFLGGASQAPGLTTTFLYLILKLFILPFGLIAGAKLATLTAIFFGGLGVASLLKRWSGDEMASWLGGVAYILGPQMALRAAGNEHLPVVLAMVFAPWILWALILLRENPSWRNALILALLGAGMSLTFTKLAVAFAPLAAFFLIYLLLTHQELRPGFLRGLLRSLAIYVPLAVIPLLPTLREMQWLALFQFDPFAAWQQNFSFKSVLSWLDRGNALQQGMPVGYLADQGGFYVGIVALVVGLLAWWRASRITPEDRFSNLLTPLKLTFGMLLFLSWMSAGPRCLAQGLLEFLKSGTGAPDFTIPIFWITAVSQGVLLWVLWPDHSRRNWGRILALAIYLLVPAFRIYEILPFAHDIRAPWSIWQVGGSLAVALLFGLGTSLLIESLKSKERGASFVKILVVILLVADYSVYLVRYSTGALPAGTYQAFEQIAASLKSAPNTGTIYPLSGRYFYLLLPSLTGKPIEQEAFNSYFGLVWRRPLQNATMSSQEGIRAGLSLMGCSYIFIDKLDPNTPPDLQKVLRGIFPVLFENQFFVVLANTTSLYPAFLAHDFVVLPHKSYALAPAVIQLLPKNLITVETSFIDQSIPGFAGTAKGSNQIELLAKYQTSGGEPFQQLPLAAQQSSMDQALHFNLPSAASGWLVLTQSYHPDWTAMVDGKPSDVYPAEAALISTYVPPGSHEVVFQFEAPSWYSFSLFLGLLSWILALAALIYFHVKGNKSQSRAS